MQGVRSSNADIHKTGSCRGRLRADSHSATSGRLKPHCSLKPIGSLSASAESPAVDQADIDLSENRATHHNQVACSRAGSPPAPVRPRPTVSAEARRQAAVQTVALSRCSVGGSAAHVVWKKLKYPASSWQKSSRQAVAVRCPNLPKVEQMLPLIPAVMLLICVGHEWRGSKR